jgi:predicted RNase H-like nuclease (RuvC/YqgF family)
MAMPALMFELETPLEERVARLEANVEHIQKDVSDMKIDIRRLGDKIDSVDQKLSAKIDSVDQKLSAKIDGVDQKLSAKTESVKDLVTALAINMEKSFANVEKSFAALHSARAFDRVWWLLMSGALLGVMARAFKWI